MPNFDYAKAREIMVESQIRTADVTDLELVSAFRRTPREPFVPQAQMALAYADAVIKYEDGQAMLRPRDFAKLVQAAEIAPNEVVLDLGCGRGYSTAILAQVSETVVGVNPNEADINRATELIMDLGVLNAAVVKGDLKRGAPEHGPFNVIIVQGAIDRVSESWLGQLANGGRLVAIVRDGPIGRATVFTKSGDTVGERVEFDANADYLPGFTPEPAFSF